jgi:predicted metal-dependent hydrolase
VRELEVGGRLVAIPVRVSARARRLKLVVDARREVEVVVPPRTPAHAVDALLVRHRDWLERQLARPPRPFRLGLQRDDCVWASGVPQPVPAVASLDAWYRERARAEATALAGEGAECLGTSFARIAIRDQRTRWGSCSTRGTLSFNWRLILAPRRIFAYVVAHELCHLVRHDHSPAFWRLVGALRPSYEEERRWLNEHGHELLAYRVPR